MGEDAAATASLLQEISHRLTLAGGNPYRARAYARAADTLRALPVPLDQVIAAGQLRDLPGIGEAMAAVIPALHSTGTHKLLDELRDDVPQSVLAMLAIPGLRPEKVLALYRQLGIGSIDALEAAATGRALAEAKGFGPAFAQKVRDGLASMRAGEGKRHMHRAADLLETAAGQLRAEMPGLREVTVAGDLRRGCELVGDLALVGIRPGPRETMRVGEITLHLAPPAQRGSALLFPTGARPHLQQLQARAAAQGARLDEDGLHIGGQVIAKAEADIYAALGLPLIPPELREGEDEIARALAGSLPKLVTEKDLRGILHAHTTRSDGTASLAEMAEATRQRGYAYLGISDHSQSAHYAGGLKLPAIEDQLAEVNRLNAEYGSTFHVLKGIESDIREDGSLDYPDEVLAQFDFVVASIHGKFRLDPAMQTARVLRAVANPFTTVLGHMTGRQLLRRPGYELDIEAVLAACAREGVAVEINANPWRLDLDWRWHRRGLELGCLFAINPDAHATGEIDNVRWGVEMARKGGVPASRVLNCLTWPRLSRWLRERRRRALTGS